MKKSIAAGSGLNVRKKNPMPSSIKIDPELALKSGHRLCILELTD
jgi:hypothetical protein